MDGDSKRQELLALTTEIVGSFVGNNTVATSDLPALIASVFQALGALGQAPTEKPAEDGALRNKRPTGKASHRLRRRNRGGVVTDE